MIFDFDYERYSNSLFNSKKYPSNIGDTVSTWTNTTTSISPDLNDIKRAIAEMQIILEDLQVKDPTVLKTMMEQVFPYVLQAIVTYEENETEEN